MMLCCCFVRFLVDDIIIINLLRGISLIMMMIFCGVLLIV